MSHVIYFSGPLVAGILLTLGGCSRDADKPAKQTPGGLEFGACAVDTVAFIVPTDQDAKGKTAEQALEQMQKGMAEDPDTLALWRRLNAGLPVELKVIEPPEEVNAIDKEAVLTPFAVQKTLTNNLQVTPSPGKVVALALCVYRPRPVQEAELSAFRFQFASCFAINLPDLRKPKVGESVRYWGWDVRLLQKDYLLRKVPGWYIHEGKNGSWDSSLTRPLVARAERTKLDARIAQHEKEARERLENLKTEFAPK